MKDPSELRKSAEEKLAPLRENLDPLSPEGMRRALHELQVHQIELEMQNEELRRTQAELEASRADYYDLYDLAPVGYCTLCEQGLIRKANLAAAALLGVNRDLLVKQPLTHFIFKEDQDLYYRLRQQLDDQGELQICELRMAPDGGEPFWANLRITPAQNGAYKLTLCNISERKRAEVALQDSERFMDNILANIDEAIVVIDGNHRIQLANRAYCEQAGKSPANIIGRHYQEISPYDNLPRQGLDHTGQLNTTFASGAPTFSTHTHIDAQGKTRQVETRSYAMKEGLGGVPFVIEVITDITDRIAIEAQLRQAQKLEAIGTLAGGIAHDFNNILSAIIGYGEIVMEELPPGSSLREEQAYVIMAGKRARDLVKQILTFSRRTEQQLEPQLLQSIVGETLTLLRASLPSTIAIKEMIDVNCGPVLAGSIQIHQVVMNLCTNAFQAMRETGGGLTITLKSVNLAEAQVTNSGSLTPGRYAVLEVADTGDGMSKAVQERIFEPFFTTKEQGHGTGLGLAVVHGIVIELGGAISVASAPDRGTTITVYLPLLENEVPVEPSIQNKELPRGTESVLVVDDQEIIVLMHRHILENLGYRVEAFTDSEHALQAFRENPDRFDLLLTDMTMPNLTGAELAVEVLRLRPSMPIIICTGYSELIDEGMAKALGVREFLQKPLEKIELAQAVRKVLD
jgi:PAS domain S-box-containing protein